jgi:ATP-dependent DNA helicase RecG
MRGRRAVRVVVADEARAKESVTLWWFFAAHGTLAVAGPGRALLVTGRIRVDPGKAARMAHPEIARDEEAARVVRPRYARSGVPEGALRKAVRLAVEGARPLPDFVPARIAARERFPPVDELLPVLHASAGSDGAPDAVARMAGVERLAWGEAFTRAWQRVTLDADEGEGRRALALPVDRAVLARLRAELGFTLTREQEKAVAEIARDLARPAPMRRLLFGDVGTGKTAVALAAAAQCVAAGAQVAILAPTSVLAEQYMEAVGPLARASGASVALVAAGVPPAQRERREAAMARGAITVAIGTHALLGEKIRFERLGLVIVDTCSRSAPRRSRAPSRSRFAAIWPPASSARAPRAVRPSRPSCACAPASQAS